MKADRREEGGDNGAHDPAQSAAGRGAYSASEICPTHSTIANPIHIFAATLHSLPRLADLLF